VGGFVLHWQMTMSDTGMSSGNTLTKSWEVLVHSLDVVSFPIQTRITRVLLVLHLTVPLLDSFIANIL